MRMVLTSTNLCLNLNGLSLSFKEIPGPELIMLILGLFKMVSNGKG
jgi:hypothetical protein